MEKKPFVIVWSSCLDTLEDRVCEWLNDGYELKGGVFPHTDTQGTVLAAQVVVPKRKHRKQE